MNNSEGLLDALPVLFQKLPENWNPTIRVVTGKLLSKFMYSQL